MNVSVPYTAIEFNYWKSGVELRYCTETGLYEEHDNEVVTIVSLGLRYSRESLPTGAVPVVTMPADSNWPNDEDF